MKIFLIGMMGCGKSYWMNKLSGKLKMPRYDLDQLIEAVEDRSIAEIFKESGEDHFRKMESIVLKWFADKDEFILATGGGTPCYHNNMDWMNEQGITIFLDEPIDLLMERLLPERSNRPLIARLTDKKLRTYLEEKRDERNSFYSKAKYSLSGDAITEHNLLTLIKENNNA
jgi:shikimate kinase